MFLADQYKRYQALFLTGSASVRHVKDLEFGGESLATTNPRG